MSNIFDKPRGQVSFDGNDRFKLTQAHQAPPAKFSRKKKHLQRWKEEAIRAFFLANGLFAVVVLGGIFALLISSAIPAFKEIPLTEFLTSKTWDPTSPEKAQYGILSMIVSTLLVTSGALVLAILIGDAVAA